MYLSLLSLLQLKHQIHLEISNLLQYDLPSPTEHSLPQMFKTDHEEIEINKIVTQRRVHTWNKRSDLMNYQYIIKLSITDLEKKQLIFICRQIETIILASTNILLRWRRESIFDSTEANSGSSTSFRAESNLKLFAYLIPQFNLNSNIIQVLRQS